MSELAFRARRRTGLSQRAFAALLDVHCATIARWESGARQPSATASALLVLIAARPQLCCVLLREHASPFDGRSR